MSTYKQILYHIVFSTKKRVPSITDKYREDLYRYIWGHIRNKKGTLYRINGTEDHIHILSDLHPSISLASYVRDIKTSTSLWMRESGNYPSFDGWEVGYGAFTYAYNDKDIIINYIRNQQEHHKRFSFAEEYKKILDEHNIEVDERFFP